MDAKDLRVEPVLGERNDRNHTYSHGDTATHCQEKTKPFQEVGPTPIPKVDVQTVRPCAVIGPDRIIPQPTSATYLKKQEPDGWGYSDGYRKVPDYSHKIGDHQHPPRNISPRQTFQESMPRVIVPPSVKLVDDSNSGISEKGSNLNENVKYNMPSDPKYYDVPYIVSPVGNDQRNLRIPDVYVPQSNSPLMRTTSAWPGPVGNPGLRPYGASDVHRYPEYPSSSSRPVPTNHAIRQMHEGSLQHYPDPYPRNGNMRYQPYPTSKELTQNTRYEYNNNQYNSYHPQLFSPQPLPQKYMLQKSFATNSYIPPYPHKYLDSRIPQEPHLDGYQRPPNNQPPGLNLTYQGHSLLSNYTQSSGNCVPNKVYSYSEGSVKPPIKSTYESHNKIPIDYVPNSIKNYPIHDNLYNEMRSYPVKGPVIMHNYPSNMPPYPPPHYRKEYIPHYAESGLNPMNPYSRMTPHFSPNLMSPSDPNINNDPYVNSDCGYISLGSSTSGRTVDNQVNKFHNPELLRRYDYRYAPFNRSSPIARPDVGVNRRGKSDKKGIDVRQFLQMWNEGDDEGSDNLVKDSNINIPEPKRVPTSQEELYVLGLVNVSNDELQKYEHIQKVSKLPENIKGYNSLELLDQFEEVIGAANVCSTPPIIIKESELRNTSLTRPASPLDVEAKISQSVIHKEVGCNFEIKPCSPKMLNVEMAAPAISIIGERTIEKVSNPHTIQPNKRNNRDKMEPFNTPNQSNEVDIIPSCKMVAPRINDLENTIKTDYGLHELESNAGVCLASLPRLDTDIEFNFPEVNQQFIDANRETNNTVKIVDNSSTDLSYATKMDNALMSHNIEIENPGLRTDLGDISASASPLSTSSYESDKNHSKLSKFRRSKTPKELDGNVNVQGQRINSVIMKNPENIDRNSGCNNDEFKTVNNIGNYINKPGINKDEIITEKRSPIPINLSYQDKLKTVRSDVNVDEQSSLQENFDENAKQKTDVINLTVNDSSNLKNGDTCNDNNLSNNIEEYDSRNNEKSKQNSPVKQDFQENEHDINNFQDTLDLSDSILDSITNLNPVDCIDQKTDEDPDATSGVHEISKNTGQDIKVDKDNISTSSEINEMSTIFDENISKDDDIPSDTNVSSSFSLEVLDNVEEEKTENIKNPVQELNNGNVRTTKDNVCSTPDNILDSVQNETKTVIFSDTHSCNVEISANVNTSASNAPSIVFTDAEASESSDVQESAVQPVVSSELSNNKCVVENNHEMDIVNDEHFEDIADTYETDTFDLDKICDAQDESISLFDHDHRDKIEDFSNFMEDLQTYKTEDDTLVCNVKSLNSPKVDYDNKDLLLKSTKHNLMEMVANKDEKTESVNAILSPTHNISDALSQIIDYDSDEYEFNSSNNYELKQYSLFKHTQRINKELYSPQFQNLFMYEVGYCRTNLGVNKHENNIMTTEDEQNKTELTKVTETPNTDQVLENPQNQADHLEFDIFNSSVNDSLNEDTLLDYHHQANSDITNTKKEEINPDEIKEIDYENCTGTPFSGSNNDDNHEEFTISNDIILPDITDIVPNLIKDSEVNNLYCGTVEKSPRRILKRSLSDSSLCNHNNQFRHWNNNNSNTQDRFSWCKRKKYNNQDECGGGVQCNRRKSTSILKNEDVSFCILISDDCIIAEQDTELIVNNICETDNIQGIIVNDIVNNVLEINSDIIEDNTEIEEATTEDFLFETPEVNIDDDVWVHDVACVETVVTDNISEDSRSSEHNASVCVNNLHLNDYVNNSSSESSYFNELDDMCVLPIVSEIAETETLYETSNNININDISDSINLDNYVDSPEIVLNDDKNKEDVCKSLHRVDSVDIAKDMKESYYNVMHNLSVLPTVFKPTKTLREIFGEPKDEILNKLGNADVAKVDDVCCQTQDDTIHSCVTSDMSPKTKRKINRTPSSSSPEVTSTTTEEKSRIFLKITNYNGSRVSIVDNSHAKHQNHVTETTQFFNSNDRSVQPLITKAAKKYIPPLKHYHDFKIKLHLPCHKLLKLKELKSAKERPKRTDEGNNMRICRNEFNKITIKKIKPKFEDVLKSLDDIQYNLHKNKPKKNFKSAIPKVVIKKKENGSHYTSSSESEYNPDMSGRKWQPWVFLEKNTFIDNMVLSNKRKAVFCPIKNMYVNSNKLRKYSHSENDIRESLKYAISLKPNV